MWSRIAIEEGATGAPLLVGALGWLECGIRDEVASGSHTFFVCDVRGSTSAWPRRRSCASAAVHRRVSRIEAVIFDLDGVLVDSEHVWDEVREELAAGARRALAQARAGGDDGHELDRVVPVHARRDRARRDAREISAEVVRRMQDRYAEELPLIDGAVDAVRRLQAVFRLGLASSSNRPLIELVLTATGMDALFEATVSSEEVERGKPAPDVYQEAARQLDVSPGLCAAVEDSANGMRAAHAAGMRVIAIPNRRYPPPADALELADRAVASLDELTVQVVDADAADRHVRPARKRCGRRAPSRSARLRPGVCRASFGT